MGFLKPIKEKDPIPMMSRGIEFITSGMCKNPIPEGCVIWSEHGRHGAYQPGPTPVSWTWDWSKLRAVVTLSDGSTVLGVEIEKNPTPPKTIEFGDFEDENEED